MTLTTATGEQIQNPSPEGGGEQIVTDPSPTPPDGEQIAGDPSPEDVFASQMGKVGEVLDGPGEPQTPPATPPQAPAEPTVQPQPQPWEAAPQHWPQEQQAEFNALPEGQKRFLYNSYQGMTADYQQKTQNLAEMRETLSEFVSNLPLQQQQPAEQPQAPVVEDTPPDDPIERIKWEAKQEMREEREQERQQEKLSRVKTATANLKAKVSQDPLKPQVMDVLNAKVNMEPDVVNPFDPHGRTYRQIEFDRLDLDPVYFDQCYRDARGMVNRRMTMPQTPPQGQSPTTRKTVTPNLVQAGRSAPGVPIDQNAKRKADIVKSIKHGKANASTLKDYLSTVNVQL